MSKVHYKLVRRLPSGHSTTRHLVVGTMFIIAAALLVAGCADRADVGPKEAIKQYIEAMRSCDPAKTDKIRAPQSLISNPVSPEQSLSWQKKCLAAAPSTLVNDAPLLISLKFASEMKPDLRNDGKLAVFDLSGMGTGMRELRFVRISDKWYYLNSWYQPIG